jgi:hypothetical protein
VDENETFNYHVSAVRVRSEHCVGFVKGRFSSLRGLRIRIDKPRDIQFAALWITTCIVLHTFAMDHEAGLAHEHDEFYLDGLRIMEGERAARIQRRREAEGDLSNRERERRREGELEVARARREELKRSLFNELYE